MDLNTLILTLTEIYLIAFAVAGLMFVHELIWKNSSGVDKILRLFILMITIVIVPLLVWVMLGVYAVALFHTNLLIKKERSNDRFI